MSEEEIEKVKGIVKRLYAGTGVTIGDIVDTAPWLDKLVNEVEELQYIKNKAIEYIEENSFEDTTGVTLNLSDENYWKVLKLLKGEDIE